MSRRSRRSVDHAGVSTSIKPFAWEAGTTRRPADRLAGAPPSAARALSRSATRSTSAAAPSPGRPSTATPGYRQPAPTGTGRRSRPDGCRCALARHHRHRLGHPIDQSAHVTGRLPRVAGQQFNPRDALRGVRMPLQRGNPNRLAGVVLAGEDAHVARTLVDRPVEGGKAGHGLAAVWQRDRPPKSTGPVPGMPRAWISATPAAAFTAVKAARSMPSRRAR